MNIFGRSNKIEPILFWAQMYLQSMRQEWPQSKLAVVFDIDDTAIPVRSEEVPADFKKVYDLANSLQYAIFFVTARPTVPGNTQFTLQQLQSVGFTRIDGLYMMPVEEMREPNYSRYKYSARQQIEQQGYSVVLNVGDSWNDLMLLPPYQIDRKVIQKIQQYIQLPKREYFIFKPPDIAWMAIKFPEVHHLHSTE